jgi:phenylalanyl-tRNA synthetase beta chain
MKISLKWLKNYVDIDLNPQAVAEKLTMAGIEVDTLQITGSTWSNIVVGEVTAVNPHPNADRLSLATVDIASQQIMVVCGAPNISPGQKVAFAHVGAQLIDGHSGKLAILKEAKIRGVVSEGMVCSEKELGISDRHEEILVLPSTAPVGLSLSEYLGDVIFNLEITPNRPDCMCVIGIAREIAALTGKTLHLPEISYKETEKVIDSSVSVEIVDGSSCPRYCASLITGVKQGPSPEWMQQYLTSYGMRPINNIVDITNYVMLEYGQPLHAFDYHRIGGRRIVVRKAEEGERITSLDGVERLLSQDMLVIADVKKPVAIAGIMGGLDAEVTDNTTTILLESANFNRSVIRRGTKYLGLQSEASLRFDKGISADLPLTALRRASRRCN